MQYYTAPPGATNPNNERVKFCLENNIFLMLSASYWARPFTRYAVDNGAWTDYKRGLEFNKTRYEKYLDKIRKQPIQPDFVILPDIFDGGMKSYELSKEYIYLADEFPVYLPVHIGLDTNDIEKDVLKDISGIFLGGSDDYRKENIGKLSEFAHKNGKKIHVGRVGTLNSFKMCYENNIDSADSSTLMRNAKWTNITKFMEICQR